MIAELKETATIQQVENFISHFPAFAGFKPELVDSGVSTAVYRLRGETEVFYLRLGNHGENMSSEALAHQLMLEKGVSVPKVLEYADADPRIGRSFMFTSEIPGVRADQDPAATAETFFQAGKQLALINSIPVDRFGWVNRDEQNAKKITGTYDTWEAWALDLDSLRSQLDNLTGLGIITREKAEKIINYVEANRNLISCPQAFLSHGDFDISHIFSSTGKYSGIIDFGDIRCASPYHDLSHCYTFSPRHFPDLLKGYLSINPLEGDVMAKIKFEAVLFGIGKLNWMIQNLPKDSTLHHPVLTLISSI